MQVLRRPALTLPTFGSLALCCAGSTADASQIVHQTQITAQPVPWSQSVDLPAFDSALGVLRQVKWTVSGSLDGSYGIENTDASPGSQPHFTLVSMIQVSLPNGVFLPAPNPAYEHFTFQQFTAFDGSIDYAGTSGTSGSFTNASGTGAPSQSVTLFSTPWVAPYAGPAGNPGLVTAVLDAQPASFGNAPPWIAHTESVSAAALVRVEYIYEPMPASFCLSASWDGCPCNNSGIYDYGCANSVNPLGAGLDVSGISELANDTLVLEAFGMPETATIFFQGSAMQYVGIPFGDGLRCLTGSLTRIGLKLNSGGEANYPETGNDPVSVRGGITTPGTYAYYQAQYRNPDPSFCTVATYNATNAIAVFWE